MSRQLLRTSLWVAALTVVLKLAAVAREMFIAARFGAGGEVDAFVAAFLPVSIGAGVLGALSSALVPVYVRRLTLESRSGADALISELGGPILALLAAVTLLAIALLPALDILTNGYSPNARELSSRLYLLLLPSLPLAAIAAVCAGVLNAREEYLFVATGPSLVPLTVILAIVMGGGGTTIEHVAVATSAGYTIYALVGMRLLRVSPRTLKWRGYRGSVDAQEVVRSFWPVAMSTLLLSGAPIVDQAMVGELGAGAAAALAFGGRVVAQVCGLATGAVGTVLLPHLSRLVASKEWTKLRRSLVRGSAIVASGSLILTLAMLAMSGQIVGFLYGRESISEAELSTIRGVQDMLLIQVPFVLTGAIFVRVLLAFGKGRIMFYGNVVSVVLNAALNMILVRNMGVAGIALATSLVYAVACAVLGAASWRSFSRAMADGPPGGSMSERSA